MAAFKSLLALVALLLAVGAGEHTEPPQSVQPAGRAAFAASLF